MEAKGTVLLVEDNAELNANNARALNMLSFAVHPAFTLAEARAWLGNNEPDVILLDVILPDGDGIDFCAEIRGLPIHTAAHILFLSAKTGHADRVRGLASGGDDYIIKPIHPEELLARVEAAMRRRSMSKPGNGPAGGMNNRIDGKEAQSGNMTEKEKLYAFAVHYDLTEKEREALSCILRRLSIKEMAASMGLSGKGVEYHITNVLLKVGIKRRRDVLQVFANWKM